jgi:hypothetical protein
MIANDFAPNDPIDNIIVLLARVDSEIDKLTIALASRHCLHTAVNLLVEITAKELALPYTIP